MTSSQPRFVKTGGDPRAFAEYAALRQEMQKLTHPARPDVDWPQVSSLCLTLFEQNGVELQSAVWYTLSRANTAGTAGMTEGLAVLVALITREWPTLWPQPAHTRVELLAGLSRRLQQFLRTQTLSEAELTALNQAARLLSEASDHLQRLELRQLSQIDPLLDRIRSAALILERSESPQIVAIAEESVAPPATLLPADIPSSGWVYVASSTLPPPEAPRFNWRAFSGGAGCALLFSALIAAGFYVTQPQPQPQPEPPQPYLDLSKPVDVAALPAEKMLGWDQGMQQLKALAQRLDGVDERRGKYVTVSELKTAVYNMTQAFNSSVPLEEELRVLQQQDDAASQLELMQTETHLKQLIARYQQIVPAPNPASPPAP